MDIWVTKHIDRSNYLGILPTRNDEFAKKQIYKRNAKKGFELNLETKWKYCPLFV